ncbi:MULTISPECIES: hypothetical protein [Pseudonocardia]|uniref:hypothetical protein n=1 Tax=Pseudonocardia TaxID=1847 RepID=UPI000F76918B|nr:MULTISPECIES: hypothetical protein [Pseudonocardia]
MPDDSDAALLFVDRGLVRAEQGPPDRDAQQRAYALAWWARRLRFAVPVVLLLAVLGAFLGTGPALVGLVLMVLMLVALLLVARRAQVAHAVAGLPVPIENIAEVSKAMRAVGAMTRVLATDRRWRRSASAGEATGVLRTWARGADVLRGAWLRADVVAWIETSRELAATRSRAEAVTRSLDPPVEEQPPGS